MVKCRNENRTRGLSRKHFDIRASEFGSRKQFKKLMKVSKFGDNEVDHDYGWFLNILISTNDQTNNIKDKDHGEDENESDDEDENESDDEDEINNNIDPQYRWFLKRLTVHGNAYKLKISKVGETPRFLVYEETNGYETPIDANLGLGNNGDNVNSSEATLSMQIDQRVKSSLHLENGDRLNSSEDTLPTQIDQRVKSSLHLEKRKILTTEDVSRKKKIDVDKSITEPHRITAGSCYQLLLDCHIPSQYGAFNYEGKLVKYEVTDTSSDSEIMMWENAKDCNEVNKKQPTPAKKDPSFKDMLMLILKKPYDHEEHKKLLEYAEEKKPICRLLPLRRRSISSALDGVTKSVLDDVPGFRRKLKDARDDPPRALNLLRMLRFWLEHLPSKDSFKPWIDEECMRARPLTRN